MANHPGITLEGACTILQQEYLRGEKYKYADDDGNILDGENWYFINNEKFNDEEFLCRTEFEKLSFAGQQDVKLPVHNFFGTTAYEGPGIQFEVDGVRYSMSDKASHSKLKTFLADGKSIAWYWNRTDSIQHIGKTSNVQIESYYLTPKCTKMPDVGFTATKPVN